MENLVFNIKENKIRNILEKFALGYFETRFLSFRSCQFSWFHRQDSKSWHKDLPSRGCWLWIMRCWQTIWTAAVWLLAALENKNSYLTPPYNAWIWQPWSPNKRRKSCGKKAVVNLRIKKLKRKKKKKDGITPAVGSLGHQAAVVGWSSSLGSRIRKGATAAFKRKEINK